jgi:hypothetical protein
VATDTITRRVGHSKADLSPFGHRTTDGGRRGSQAYYAWLGPLAAPTGRIAVATHLAYYDAE